MNVAILFVGLSLYTVTLGPRERELALSSLLALQALAPTSNGDVEKVQTLQARNSLKLNLAETRAKATQFF